MALLKKIGSLVIRLGISGLILFFILQRVELRKVFMLMQGADKFLLLLAASTAFFSAILCFLRWRMLLVEVDITLPAKRLISAYSAGVFFNSFLPSTIGGDILRTADLSYHSGRPSAVLATVFLDRISGYMGLGIVLFAAVILGWRWLIYHKDLFYLAILILVVLWGIIFVIFYPSCQRLIGRLLKDKGVSRLKELLKEMQAHIQYVSRQRPLVSKNILFSVLIQLTGPLGTYFVLSALGAKADILFLFLAVPVSMAVTILPITIAGLGVREAMAIYLLGKINIAKDVALTTSLISFFIMMGISLAAGIIYALTLHYRRV